MATYRPHEFDDAPAGYDPAAAYLVVSSAAFGGTGMRRVAVSAGTVLTVGKSLWVDATNGSDATGTRGRADKPFLTVDAAVAAATAGDTIYVGPGTYASPTAEKAGLTYRGAGRPRFDSITAPTALTGGTILQGPWAMTLTGQRVYDLGVDCGSAVCTASYSGTAQEGLTFAQASPSSVVDFEAQNITVLCKAAASAVHAVRVENAHTARLSNIWTYYGQHGVAAKGSDVSLHTHRGWAHGQDSLVIKADAGQTVTAARCSDLYYRDGAGVLVYGGGGTLTNVYLENLTVEECAGVGVDVLGSSNISLLSVRGYRCFRASGPINAGLDTGQLTGVLATLILSDAYLHGGSGGFQTAGLRIGNGANASTTVSLLSNVVQRNAATWGGMLYSGTVQLSNCNFGNALFVSGSNPACTAYAPPAAVVAAGGVTGSLTQTGP